MEALVRSFGRSRVGTGGRPRRRRRPRLRRLIACATLLIALLVVVLLVASAVLFVWPATDNPRRVDAIVSLNGRDEASRERLAIHLAESGYARVVLFSLGNSGATRCPRVPRIRVVCFVAEPPRTAGEVEFAAKFARRHGWHSLMLVPIRPQVTRARMLMKRCFSGQITIVAASVPLTQLPYEVIYEWGALVKALVIDRRC